MQTTNVSIQGNPVTQAGISYGYYGYTNMISSLYTNSEAKQKYDKALQEFLNDYGSFHATFKTTDPFFGLLDWF